MVNSGKKQTLRDAGVLLIDCDHRTPPAYGSGYPYVAIPQLKKGRIDFSGARRITPEHFIEWTRKANPKTFDVVLSRRCNPGETAFVDGSVRFALGQNLVLLRSDGSLIHPPFLRWLVRSQEWWEQVEKFLNVGAVFDSLKCADIPKFELTIPSMEKQHGIAHVLSTLDDKIELNRRMNETLEAMAQALFKSWFIDLDPFEPLELAGMPKGWAGTSVYECAAFINGVAFSKVNFSDDDSGLPIVKIAELKDGITSQTKFTNDQLPKKYRIRDGDILFSWSGSPDTSIGTFIWSGGEAWLNQHIFKIEAHQPYEKLFVYYLLKHLKPTFIEIARDKQTTGLGHVTAQDLKRLRVAFPSPAALKEFQRLVEPFFNRSLQTLIESHTLSALRDALLPKLLSGEIRLNESRFSNEENFRA